MENIDSWFNCEVVITNGHGINKNYLKDDSIFHKEKKMKIVLSLQRECYKVIIDLLKRITCQSMDSDKINLHSFHSQYDIVDPR